MVDGIVINKSDYFDKYKRLKTFIENNFSVTYYILFLVKNFNKNDNQIIDQYNDPSLMWVDEKNASIYGYKVVDNAIANTTKIMNELYIYLDRKDISLSIVVYPWPYQVKNDKINSRQVKIWKNFCKDKCKIFIDSHKPFFTLKNNYSDEEIIDKFYIKGDGHFNKLGNEILAKEFIKNYYF